MRPQPKAFTVEGIHVNHSSPTPKALTIEGRTEVDRPSRRGKATRRIYARLTYERAEALYEVLGAKLAEARDWEPRTPPGPPFGDHCAECGTPVTPGTPCGECGSLRVMPRGKP